MSRKGKGNGGEGKELPKLGGVDETDERDESEEGDGRRDEGGIEEDKRGAGEWKMEMENGKKNGEKRREGSEGGD